MGAIRGAAVNGLKVDDDIATMTCGPCYGCNKRRQPLASMDVMSPHESAADLDLLSAQTRSVAQQAINKLSLAYCDLMPAHA